MMSLLLTVFLHLLQHHRATNDKLSSFSDFENFSDDETKQINQVTYNKVYKPYYDTKVGIANKSTMDISVDCPRYFEYNKQESSKTLFSDDNEISLFPFLDAAFAIHLVLSEIDLSGLYNAFKSDMSTKRGKIPIEYSNLKNALLHERKLKTDSLSLEDIVQDTPTIILNLDAFQSVETENRTNAIYFTYKELLNLYFHIQNITNEDIWYQGVAIKYKCTGNSKGIQYNNKYHWIKNYIVNRVKAFQTFKLKLITFIKYSIINNKTNKERILNNLDEIGELLNTLNSEFNVNIFPGSECNNIAVEDEDANKIETYNIKATKINALIDTLLDSSDFSELFNKIPVDTKEWKYSPDRFRTQEILLDLFNKKNERRNELKKGLDETMCLVKSEIKALNNMKAFNEENSDEVLNTRKVFYNEIYKFLKDRRDTFVRGVEILYLKLYNNIERTKLMEFMGVSESSETETINNDMSEGSNFKNSEKSVKSLNENENRYVNESINELVESIKGGKKYLETEPEGYYEKLKGIIK